MAIKQYWCTLYRWSKSGYKNQCREKNCKSSASGGIRTHDLQDVNQPRQLDVSVNSRPSPGAFGLPAWLSGKADTRMRAWDSNSPRMQQLVLVVSIAVDKSVPIELFFSNGTWSLFFRIILGWIFHLSRNIKSLFQSILRRIELEEVFQNTWDFVLDDIKTNLFNRGTCSSKHL